LIRPYKITSHKYLTAEEELAVKESFDETKDDKALALETLYWSGARISEVMNLEAVDLLINNTIYIRGLKGSEDREIPMPKDVFKRLEAVLTRKGRWGFNVRTLQRYWGKFRPKGCDKSIHSLRHTCAIRIYKQTHDILLVKDFLGHKSITNTMVYAKQVRTQEEFRKLVAL
jgi:integrase/recombinase XerC